MAESVIKGETAALLEADLKDLVMVGGSVARTVVMIAVATAEDLIATGRIVRAVVEAITTSSAMALAVMVSGVAHVGQVLDLTAMDAGVAIAINSIIRVIVASLVTVMATRADLSGGAMVKLTAVVIGTGADTMSSVALSAVFTVMIGQALTTATAKGSGRRVATGVTGKTTIVAGTVAKGAESLMIIAPDAKTGGAVGSEGVVKKAPIAPMLNAVERGGRTTKFVVRCGRGLEKSA